MENLCVGEDFCEELTCAVCLDSWKDPIELSPCGHIFCKACATSLKECPVCRKPIESTKTPNRTLVNMALQIQVRCRQCQWKGTREQGMSHVCGKVMESSPSGPSCPPWVATSQPQQHPTAAWFPSPYVQPSSYAGHTPSPGATQQQTQDYPDLWESGAPTQLPKPSVAQSTSGGNAYSGAAPLPSGGNTGYQGSYPTTNNYSNPSGAGYSGHNPQPQPSCSPQRRYRVIEPTGSRPWALYGLDQAEYDQIVSLFVFFDDDDSGTLDFTEVARLARWLNFANTPKDVKRIFDDMNFDRSGKLSLGEFLTWLRYNKPNPNSLYGLTQAQYNTIMMQFHTYDTNQDGCLEMNQFSRLVQHIGDVRDAATAQHLFQMIDRDRDGAISLHEFLLFRSGKH
ncbi:zinc finger, C3HC4 type (RING finger)/EF-hand domain pair, putative [Leishmania tarentolae]|uniref:Zinc finger, C3HC4 type (RING finger)/EF-hand domain pair, putative n=1 Tax=Leishmania tarentolae TaxID=5689 RepID=A0A640KHP7_LEITA|nr:zinc finger, C3HC4 type (RING finger)/EF-hand domain pair, putative [Leishmania tarentolae]